jgi:DNA-binding transcriptional LysR family regulator
MEFHPIAGTGNCGRAAERCQIARPSLSQQVLKLEEDLGAKLFDRLGGSVLFTEAGRFFIPHARAVLVGSRPSSNGDGRFRWLVLKLSCSFMRTLLCSS